MTRLMVLGLLKMKPMSGYEIQQILEVSQTDLWAGILPGSIYHALKKMEKEGLVEIDSIEQTGHRIKAIYKITEKGEQEIVLLIKQSLESSSASLPTAMYTAISFIDEIRVEERIEAIQRQRKVLVEELEKQKSGEIAKAAYVAMDEVTKLTFANMYKQYEIQIEYCDRLLELFED